MIQKSKLYINIIGPKCKNKLKKQNVCNKTEWFSKLKIIGKCGGPEQYRVPCTLIDHLSKQAFLTKSNNIISQQPLI